MTSSTRQSVLLYGCAFAIAGGTPFVLLPILTRHLSPQQFGEVTAFLMVAALLSSVAGLTAHGFVSVRYFKTAPDQFRVLVATSMLAVTVTHALAALLVAALYPLLARTFDLPLTLALLAVAAALALNLNQLFLAIFQASGRPAFYLQARLIQGALEFGLCLALIHWVAADAQARTHSYVLAIAASALLGWRVCLRARHVAWQVSAEHFKGLIRFGVPTLPHVVAGTSIAYVDRMVISGLLGAESLGIYMVAMQIGMAMVALIEPLNKALLPWLFSQLAKDSAEVRSLIVRRTYQLFAALVLLGIAVATLAHLAFDFIAAPSYAAARPLVPWMVTGFVLQGMYYAVVNYLFYAERTGRLSMVSGATAVMGCLTSYVLTTQYGLTGAGASFVLNNAVLFALVWYAAAKAVPMPWFQARR